MILRSSITISHGFLFPKISCTSNLNPNMRNYSIPARDKVIDFGKYKGKMMGTLPSSYLKLVSKNLRAGDSLHWAHLADQVLQDPVYKDRIEWEFAEAVLNGNSNNRASSNVGVCGNNAVSELLEITERFGWDNEDKAGWSNLNFELLGTSRGGRIPRLCHDNKNEVSMSPYGVSIRNLSKSRIHTKDSSNERGHNLGTAKPVPNKVNGSSDEEKGGNVISSRMRRIDRMRLKLKKEGAKESKVQFFGGNSMESRARTSRTKNGSYSFMNGNKKVASFRNEEKEEECRYRIDDEPEVYNPFPGRESFLRRVLERGGRR